MTKTIADRIKEERVKTGLNQQEFAKKIGTDPANISRWEAEKINITTDSAIKLANAFGVTLDYLLTGKREKNLVGIYSYGGIITHVESYETLVEGILFMRNTCIENRFRFESDDARIFEIGEVTEQVHSFDHEEMEATQ